MCERDRRTHVWGSSQCKITLVQQFQKLLFSRTTESFNINFSCDLHCRCEVPHLNTAVTMTTEEVPAGSGTNAAGSFTFMNHECRDGGPIHRAHLTNPFPIGGEPHIEFIGVRNHTLDKYLLLVSFPIRTYFCSCSTASMAINIVQ